MSATKTAPTKRPAKAATVDEYLAQLDPPTRRVLERLRRQIRRAAPQATERISYQIPTYTFHGPLLHFAAQPKHLALYGPSRQSLHALREELKDFRVEGRTIRFSVRKPLPASLVQRIVQARVRENQPAGPAGRASDRPARGPRRRRS